MKLAGISAVSNPHICTTWRFVVCLPRDSVGITVQVQPGTVSKRGEKDGETSGDSARYNERLPGMLILKTSSLKTSSPQGGRAVHGFLSFALIVEASARSVNTPWS